MKWREESASSRCGLSAVAVSVGRGPAHPMAAGHGAPSPRYRGQAISPSSSVSHCPSRNRVGPQSNGLCLLSLPLCPLCYLYPPRPRQVPRRFFFVLRAQLSPQPPSDRHRTAGGFRNPQLSGHLLWQGGPDLRLRGNSGGTAGEGHQLAGGGRVDSRYSSRSCCAAVTRCSARRICGIGIWLPRYGFFTFEGNNPPHVAVTLTVR